MSMLDAIKALEGYSNSRGLLPGQANIHVLPDSMVWSGDGDVELWLFDHPLPARDARWDVNAQQLVGLVRAAGANAEVSVSEDSKEVSVAGHNFEGTTPLVEDDSASLWEAFPEHFDKIGIVAPNEFTTALGIAAKYSAKEGNAGAYWMAVVLRGGDLWASNQGYGFAKVALDHKVTTERDVLIPARACEAAANSGMLITEMQVDHETGLGAFLLNEGKAAIVFRLVPVDGAYPDLATASAKWRPAENAKWAEAILIQNELSRVALAADAKLPLVELRKNGHWELAANGRGAAKVALPLFRPDDSASSVTLPLKRWNQMMEAAAEVLPMEFGVWFRAGFNVDGGRCILEGVEMSYIAPEPAPEKPKKTSAKKSRAEREMASG